MARIVLPSETLNYFSPVRVEQTSTETHIHLDERMPLHYPMMWAQFENLGELVKNTIFVA